MAERERERESEREKEREREREREICRETQSGDREKGEESQA